MAELLNLGLLLRRPNIFLFESCQSLFSYAPFGYLNPQKLSANIELFGADTIDSYTSSFYELIEFVGILNAQKIHDEFELLKFEALAI